MSASYYSSRAVPSLRDSCDTNVQVAFSEGRWPTVVTLAKNQFKRTRDPYYEAVELAARSRLESPVDQRAALVEVEKILAENGKVKDYWTLDLYEWACRDVENDYSKTIGLLRASFVKDVWKATDKDAVKAARLSFYACVVNDDWINAQKIVAILDQKFPKESRYYFSNVLAYYISSSKLSPIDPKRAMFKTLAKRLIDKARELHDNTPASEGYPPRAINSEEELRLWLEINVKSAETKAEVFALLKRPEFDPLKRLSEGYVSVFKDIMSLLEEHEAWDEIFTISEEVLIRGTNLLTESESGAKKEVEARAIRSAVMDWSLWKQFIHAAGHFHDEKRALDQLHTYSSKLSEHTKLPRIIQKQLDLAKLLVLLGRHRPNAETEGSGTEETSNARIDQLTAYVTSNYSLVSCFEDLKPYLEQLSFDEITSFLERLGTEGEKETNDVFQNTMILTLRLRFRYMFITSPKSFGYQRDGGASKCRFCDSITLTSTCTTCLKSIAKSCAWTYNAGFDNRDLRTRINSEDVDPFAEIAIIGATCLLKLARFSSQPSGLKACAMQSVDLKQLLQAIAWLSSHSSRVPQKNQGMPVLLTKLYLLAGCVSHAKELWDSLEVKNVTLDSLGPLFSDRLSSIAPGMWRASGGTPMYPYHKHFNDVIRRNIPNNIRTALEHGNFTSVLGLLRTQDRLSRSCTMVMSNVEDRRGLRAIGSKFTFDVKDDPLLRKINGDVEFINVTDTAALPNHEHSPSTLADFIGIGPGLSDLRAKLSFHAEDFISLVSYKDAKDFKPTKGAQVAELDRMYISESAERISRTLSEPFVKCLEAADGTASAPVVTTPELSYFTVINFLNRFVAVSTRAQWNKSTPRPTAVSTAVASVAAALKRQADSLNAAAPLGTPESDAALLHFASLHGLGMLRESAAATKLTVACLERATGPVPKGDVPKWLGEDLKALAGAAGDAAAAVKRRVQALNQAAGASGWLDTIARFAFGGLADGSKTVPAEAPANAANGDLETMVFVAAGRSAGLEQTVGEIKDSWQAVAKGWATVKLD